MNTDKTLTLRSDCAALAALLDRMTPAPVRPGRLPARLDAAKPGDTVVLVDCRGGVQRRLVEVEALDGGAILVDGEKYHKGHGFHLEGLAAGNLDRVVQPADDWSWPGWSGSMSLEL